MLGWDVIVLGVGGMGSAALHHLAKRGHRVLGIEQFDIAHDRGSSHGDTRIIRKAYFECPDYVPLAVRSYELWSELEAATHQKLFTKTGLLSIGKPDCVLMAGTRRSADEHQLWLENLTTDDVRSRFPGFMPSEGMSAVLEPEAGFLAVEACVKAHADQAIKHGAKILANQRVTSWHSDGNTVEVKTTDGAHVADRLIVCAGAWSGPMLKQLGLPLEVRRKPVFWFAPADKTYDVDRGSPTFAIQNDEGFFYGFPREGSGGVKVAEHFGAEPVEDADHLNREVRDEEALLVRGFMTEHMPSLTSRLTRTSVCMYTMTPDEHFIIDKHPNHSNVVFAAGFSGHGFKFTPVVGSILTDLAIDGTTNEPIEFLSMRRSAIASRMR